MQRNLIATLLLFIATTNTLSAEPFEEVTVGIPVASISQAEDWYTTFLGENVESFSPAPGVVEFKVSPSVWLQVFETDAEQYSEAAVRFLVQDMASAQKERAKVGIDTGTAVEIPDVVTYTEFVDPFGNSLGFYELP